MSEENISTSGEGKIDISALRAELIDSNRTMFNTLSSELRADLSNVVASFKDSAPQVRSIVNIDNIENNDLGEYKDEISAIGLDESQAEAMLRLLKKVSSKETSVVSDRVKKEFTEEQDKKALMQRENSKTAQLYPDVLDKGSSLWSEAVKVYNAYSDSDKQSPRAMANAVREAAADLGISPLTLEDIRAREAVNNTSRDTTADSKKSASASDAELEMAKSFGIDLKTFSETLKAKKNK